MKRALITIATALLLAPAAASAATTYTVEPGGSIAAALAQATDGDTIHVRAGTFAEQPLTVAHAVRIEGESMTTVTSTSTDSTKAVFTVNHDGVTIASMSVSSPSQGGRLVLSQARDLVLDGVSLLRTSGPADTPVVEVGATPTSGSTTISRSFIANVTGATGNTSPAVVGGPTNSLAISETVVLSGVGQGPALRFAGAGGQPNTFVRSSAVALEAGSDGVQVQSTGSGDKQLTIDSSILSGGASAASLRAQTSNSLLALNTGNLAVVATHATIAGAASGIATQVSSVGLGSPGSISVSADRSIVRGSVASGVSLTNSDT